MLNTLTDKKHKDKSEAGDKEKSGETVQDARKWMDKNRLTEKDEFEIEQEKLVEVTQLILQDCISERIVERPIDVLVPQVPEHCVDIAKVILQKHLPQYTGEQIVVMPVSQIRRVGTMRRQDTKRRKQQSKK